MRLNEFHRTLMECNVGIKYSPEKIKFYFFDDRPKFSTVNRVSKLISSEFGVSEDEMELVVASGENVLILEIEVSPNENELETMNEPKVIDGWNQLTGKFFFKVNANTLIFANRVGDSFVRYASISLDKVKLIYEDLPPEANTADLHKLLLRYEVNIPRHVEPLLLRAIAVIYNGELKKEGNSLVLYKRGR